MVYFAVKTFLVNLERIIPFMDPASYAKSIPIILVVLEVEGAEGVGQQRPKEMAEMGAEIDKMENKIKANLALK